MILQWCPFWQENLEWVTRVAWKSLTNVLLAAAAPLQIPSEADKQLLGFCYLNIPSPHISAQMSIDYFKSCSNV